MIEALRKKWDDTESEVHVTAMEMVSTTQKIEDEDNNEYDFDEVKIIKALQTMALNVEMEDIVGRDALKREQGPT
jgi:hypothetical protein